MSILLFHFVNVETLSVVEGTSRLVQMNEFKQPPLCHYMVSVDSVLNKPINNSLFSVWICWYFVDLDPCLMGMLSMMITLSGRNIGKELLLEPCGKSWAIHFLIMSDLQSEKKVHAIYIFSWCSHMANNQLSSSPSRGLTVSWRVLSVHPLVFWVTRFIPEPNPPKYSLFYTSFQKNFPAIYFLNSNQMVCSTFSKDEYFPLNSLAHWVKLEVGHSHRV